MKNIIVLLLLLCSTGVYSQDWPVKKMVMAKKEKNIAFEKITPFSFLAKKQLAERGTYQQLKLSKSFQEKIIAEKPEALQLSVPVSSSKTMLCDLVKVRMGTVVYTENNSSIIPGVKEPVLYQGIVNGEKNKNTVVLTVNDEYLGLTASFADKTIQLTQADENDKTLYRVYNSSEVNFPVVPFDCGTKPSVSQTAMGIDISGGSTPHCGAGQMHQCICGLL